MINIKRKIILIGILLVFSSIIFLYKLDKIISPIILNAADIEMKNKTTEIINKTVLENCEKNFVYNEIINIYKDESGNINMIKADTIKLNKLACDVALDSQNKLKDFGTRGVKLPASYIFKNNIISFFGPSIKVKMQPIGYTETKYISDFTSAGINQTNHKISMEVITNIRIIIPLNSKDIEVKKQVPISETIIVGRVPESSINMEIGETTFKTRYYPLEDFHIKKHN
ncbi:sporulation protein YunB [Clostridium cochlearium]|uniref:Sporulation protein YunB n=1 Tax=Clostridium cochlearium TaxID=1494 RepID=A0A7Y4DDG0_CLOCO|nr:sporulation protein YunB [Clostridium cochlearium]NOH16277.1 sporulation protein YunB [Clostridium cochlearium]